MPFPVSIDLSEQSMSGNTLRLIGYGLLIAVGAFWLVKAFLARFLVDLLAGLKLKSFVVSLAIEKRQKFLERMERLSIADAEVQRILQTEKKKDLRRSKYILLLFLSCEPQDKIILIKHATTITSSDYWKQCFTNYIRLSQQ